MFINTNLSLIGNKNASDLLDGGIARVNMVFDWSYMRYIAEVNEFRFLRSIELIKLYLPKLYSIHVLKADFQDIFAIDQEKFIFNQVDTFDIARCYV